MPDDLRILRLITRGGQQIRVITSDATALEVQDMWAERTRWNSVSIMREPQRVVRIPDNAAEETSLLSAVIDLDDVSAVAVYRRNGDDQNTGQYA